MQTKCDMNFGKRAETVGIRCSLVHTTLGMKRLQWLNSETKSVTMKATNWAEMYGENDYFIIVEEGLSPHKLKSALKHKGNIDFKAGRWVGNEKKWRKLWRK